MSTERGVKHLLVSAAFAGLSACTGGPPAKLPFSPADTTTPSPLSVAPAVHVQGNHIVDALGHIVRLRGVNRSGTEYACAQGWGIFDGPSDSASVRAMAAWNVTIVRVPMNETCWLGINGVKPAYSGAAYRLAIADYVSLLNRHGMVAVLDLHWTAAGSAVALAQQPMPNRDHTVEFWRQVATAFRGNDAVIFDLFNEPYPDANRDTPEAWRCWRDGGACSQIGFTAAGMQELVDTIRAAGATNVLLVGGVQYASGLSHWLDNVPRDPRNNVAASWHVYNFGWCNTAACWNTVATPIAQRVPLVLGELGQDDGGNAFVNALMDWMDAYGAGYMAWVWDVWGSPLDLIRSYDGTPTSYGQTFKTRFGQVGAAPAGTQIPLTRDVFGHQVTPGTSARTAP